MIPRTENHNWGSHEVFAKNMTAHINVDPDTKEISFNGNFQTKKVLYDNDSNVIAQERGPNINLNSLEMTDDVTLADGTTLTVAQVVETITEFYKSAYDKQKLAEKELI